MQRKKWRGGRLPPSPKKRASFFRRSCCRVNCRVDDDALLTYLSVLILGRHLDTRDRLPEPTQSPPKACKPCTSAAHSRRRRCAALLYARPHTSAPAAHCIPSRAGIASHHLPQGFLDTIHTDAAVYVFSAPLPPPSCPQKVNRNSPLATISGTHHYTLGVRPLRAQRRTLLQSRGGGRQRLLVRVRVRVRVIGLGLGLGFMIANGSSSAPSAPSSPPPPCPPRPLPRQTSCPPHLC